MENIEQVEQAVTKEQEAIKAAQDEMIAEYTTMHRSAIKNWFFEDEQIAKMEFNESGYLAAGVKDSRVLEHTGEGTIEEEWIVEIVPDVGVDVESEEYRVYQNITGDTWIVEKA